MYYVIAYMYVVNVNGIIMYMYVNKRVELAQRGIAYRKRMLFGETSLVKPQSQNAYYNALFNSENKLP